MESKLIKIFAAQDNIQAEMIVDTLKDNNIAAIKEDLGNAGLMNLYSGNSRAGENIYVMKDDMEAAEEILIGMGLM